MMNHEQIRDIYDSVCDAPLGSSLHIQHMPHFLLTDPNDNSASHVHTFYEILWFHNAGGTHSVDFRDYEIQENTLFFLAPGQVHHFDGQTMHHGTLIQFCTDFMRDEQNSDDLLLKYDVFNSQGVPSCQISDADCVRDLHALVHRMEAEITQRNAFGHMEMLRSLVRQFLILTYRFGQRENGPRLDSLRPAHRLYIQFRQLVERDFSRRHTVAEYAQALNVSVRTLTNCVAECADSSPLVLINNRIVLEAKRLLRHSPLMVKEVAQRLGYEDVSYFVKFFKRIVGVLPTAYQGSAH